MKKIQKPTKTKISFGTVFVVFLAVTIFSLAGC